MLVGESLGARHALGVGADGEQVRLETFGTDFVVTETAWNFLACFRVEIGEANWTAHVYSLKKCTHCGSKQITKIFVSTTLNLVRTKEILVWT